MSFAVAGLVVPGVKVQVEECVKKPSPTSGSGSRSYIENSQLLRNLEMTGTDLFGRTCMTKQAKSHLYTAPAKISQPRLSGFYPRARLYRAMDEARRKPVIWISAPAGSGKTTLVAGYLKDKGLRHLWYQMDERDADPASFFYYLRAAAGKLAPRKNEPLPLLAPEYLLGVPVFSRNFFEQLYGRFKPPCVLVFDNFQELPENAILQRLIVEALDIIPQGLNVIILSRTAPPPGLARIRSRQCMAHLDEIGLLFTQEEIASIADLKKEEKHLGKRTRPFASNNQGVGCRSYADAGSGGAGGGEL